MQRTLSFMFNPELLRHLTDEEKRALVNADPVWLPKNGGPPFRGCLGSWK
jgi:hypothetical protein